MICDDKRIKSDKVLDTRGLQYPMQLRKIKRALETMKTGNILEIWDSDPHSHKEIPDIISTGANLFIDSIRDPEGYTRYFIMKG